MATLIDDKLANQACDKGLKVGQTSPSRETKYSWFQVYKLEDQLIACVMDESIGCVCGEAISTDELGGYVDDLEAAWVLLRQAEGEEPKSYFPEQT
ncbi:MAG: hypothetical protein WAW36_18955 [Methylovulum miyakonense]|uniref:hypothetical protein n=1 Tax=Methylovulum miyakonense TaxID=645578 RepID=UPI003BB642B4